MTQLFNFFFEPIITQDHSLVGCISYRTQHFSIQMPYKQLTIGLCLLFSLTWPLIEVVGSLNINMVPQPNCTIA
jgi:hypothetical protein